MLRAAAFVIVLVAARGAPADDFVYVAPGDPHDLAVLPAPLPEVHFGALAARLAAGATEAPAPPPFVERGEAPVPVAAPALADLSSVRVAAVRLRRAFTTGDEVPRVKVLKLAVRYQDALIARLNGVEIARRNLAPDAGPTALSQKTRGGEWETIPIAVADGLLRRGENLLEVEVRPSAARLAPWVDVTLTGSTGVRVVRGPMVQRVGPDRATIVFETDLPVIGEVRVGSRRLRGGDEAATRHVVEVDGLAPGQEARYRVAVQDGEIAEVGPELSFHTAPPPGEVVRFVVYGDVRTGHETHAEIVRAVTAEAPDFVLSTGDHVMRGTDEGDWQRFFTVAGGMLASAPFYPVLGNHDLGAASGSERRFEDVFVLERPADCPEGSTWYGFDHGSLHVVVIDSNRLDDERQLAWLEADLAAARGRGARAIVAAMHHGPFSRGPHGGHPIAAARYVPVLARHGTAILFSGHDHIYQRGEAGGLAYLVSGGGGAPLYPIKCGAPGRPACRGDDGARVAVAAHHYVAVEVYRDDLRLCPKRPDGTPLEECVRIALPQPRLTSR
jgi:hypothetical protein